MKGSLVHARYSSKDKARQLVWDALSEQRAARFPFPPHGRIPNFDGAKEAAVRLLAHPIFEKAKCIKVNPDAPQRYIRAAALQKGITVVVPTPRLKGGFKRLDPAKIPPAKLSEAASLSKGHRWAEEISVETLPAVDLIVTGCVAVTRAGHRCGKGHGYGDLEYAIFRELGHPPVPVATTVHSLQIVDGFPTGDHDLPVNIIATPEELIEVVDHVSEPTGIQWDKLTRDDLEEMPILKELQSWQKRSF